MREKLSPVRQRFLFPTYLLSLFFSLILPSFFGDGVGEGRGQGGVKETHQHKKKEKDALYIVVLLYDLFMAKPQTMERKRA